MVSALEQQLPTELSRQKKLKKPQKKLLKAELQNRAGSWIAANQPSLGQLHSLKPQTGSMSFALRPFKKSPCGGCPALKGKLCRCALKYQQRLQQAANAFSFKNRPGLQVPLSVVADQIVKTFVAMQGIKVFLLLGRLTE